jgi:hypothetical protein
MDQYILFLLFYINNYKNMNVRKLLVENIFQLKDELLKVEKELDS